MSDQVPSAFGATQGQGVWGVFTDFLENPDKSAGLGSSWRGRAEG